MPFNLLPDSVDGNTGGMKSLVVSFNFCLILYISFGGTDALLSRDSGDIQQNHFLLLFHTKRRVSSTTLCVACFQPQLAL